MNLRGVFHVNMLHPKLLVFWIHQIFLKELVHRVHKQRLARRWTANHYIQTLAQHHVYVNQFVLKFHPSNVLALYMRFIFLVEKARILRQRQPYAIVGRFRHHPCGYKRWSLRWFRFRIITRHIVVRAGKQVHKLRYAKLLKISSRGIQSFVLTCRESVKLVVVDATANCIVHLLIVMQRVVKLSVSLTCVWQKHKLKGVESINYLLYVGNWLVCSAGQLVLI